MAEEWFELRVAGSAGTTLGLEAEMTDGKAIGDAGRLVILSSAQARRFLSIAEALEFLATSSVGHIYNVEVVRCTETSAAPVQPRPIYSRGS